MRFAGWSHGSDCRKDDGVQEGVRAWRSGGGDDRPPADRFSGRLLNAPRVQADTQACQQLQSLRPGLGGRRSLVGVHQVARLSTFDRVHERYDEVRWCDSELASVLDRLVAPEAPVELGLHRRGAHATGDPPQAQRVPEEAATDAGRELV
ncbi:hypothetical protein GCM10020366_59130 [Saccharopolyspora gregorii]|uniref:Uncharacterized protein n=1 Tax=Saccharopolyspora gregorii TaxID=33914 RepID=A0ABP6RZL9_9PSEU